MVALIKKCWPALLLIALFVVPKSTFAADWVSVGFADSNFKTVYVDPKNNQHIIVSLFNYLDNKYNYYTEDGGSTWQPVGIAMTPCENFVANPLNSQDVWAGCAVGLWHSTDGGKNFSVIERYRATQGIRVSISSDGTIYLASLGNNLHRSRDGIIWEVLNIPGASYQPNIHLNKYKAAEVYLSLTGAGSAGLYRSADWGSNWALLNNETMIGRGVNQLTFGSTGKMCASVGSFGIGCSSDAGFTWSEFVSPNPAVPHESQHFYNLVQNPDDDKNLLVLAGAWGGTDIKIYNYASDSTLPTITSINMSLSGFCISQGVVFTWGSYGWTKSLWRNDGIAVMPEYLKKHPVIIVPGILGSWSKAPVGTWDFEPLYNTYTDLYNKFLVAGYIPGKTLFKFPYQWRSDNRETAYLLKQKIDEAKLASGSQKVDIVAHSMGGIVARIYAQSGSYQNDIDQLIFLGTPHQGSATSYPIWEAADLTQLDVIERVLLWIILKEESWQKGYILDPMLNYVRNDVPSIAQLLPINSYLNGKNYPEQYPRNELLENLEASKSILQWRGIKVTNIAGDGISTFSTADILNGDFGIYWPDGKPAHYYHTTGDGTVTLESQLGVSGSTVIKNGVRHIDLPRRSIEDVFAALNISYSPAETIKIINKYLFIAAYSPVDFYVLAPDGKKIGFNKDGEAFNEINGAFYTGNDSETEFLTIPNPLPGEYKVMTYGTGTGNYEIETTYADDEANNSFSSSYTGQATPGKEDKLLVELNLETKSIETKIDDKTAPTTMATPRGDVVNGYYNTDAIVTLTAVDDESGLRKTEYSLDGILWQDYSTPIILSQDGETIIYYRSVDNADNVEASQTITVKIDKTAPTVLLDLNKTTLTHWDKLKLVCEVTDSYAGVKEFLVKLDGTVIGCAASIDLIEQELGNHKIEFSATDQAGNTTYGERNFQIVANYDSTIQDIFWLYENKHFKSFGEAMSVAVHVEAARVFDSLGFSKKSANSLEQTVFLLVKQTQKNKITGYGYDMIMKDIKYILEGM